MLSQNFPEELNPSAFKHLGLLLSFDIHVFPCAHPKITIPGCPQLFLEGRKSCGAKGEPVVPRCPRSTCRHGHLAVMGMMEERGPVPELRPYRSSHPLPAEWLQPSQLKRNLKGARGPRAALPSLITFSSVTVINTPYLRGVY